MTVCLFYTAYDFEQLLTMCEIDAKYTYSLSTTISPSNATVSSLAILKRASQLDVSSSLESQLQIVNLPNLQSNSISRQKLGNSEVKPETQYDVIYSLIHLAIAPYFDALTRGKETALGVSERAARIADTKTGI